MFAQVLSPMGTWEADVQYKFANIQSAAGLGGGYVSVPFVISGGVSYYAIVAAPTLGDDPASTPLEWQSLGSGGGGTGTMTFSGNTMTGTSGSAVVLNAATGMPVGINGSLEVLSGGTLRINEVLYNFPAYQGAANSTFINDGDGNLNWGSLTGNFLFSGSTMSGTANEELQIKAFDGNAIGLNNYLTVTGNQVGFNGIPYSFPASQGAASTFLSNDGAGNLTWVPGSGGSTGTITFVGNSMTGSAGSNIVIAAATGNVIKLNSDTDINGNLAINTVPYAFPSSQGALNTVLVNNGAGGLSWSSVTGTGTVTSLSSADLSPLFLTSVATTTTTPAITYTLEPASAHAFWCGPTTGGFGTPSYRAIDSSDIPLDLGAKTFSGAVTIAEGGGIVLPTLLTAVNAMAGTIRLDANGEATFITTQYGANSFPSFWAIDQVSGVLYRSASSVGQFTISSSLGAADAGKLIGFVIINPNT